MPIIPYKNFLILRWVIFVKVRLYLIVFILLDRYSCTFSLDILTIPMYKIYLYGKQMSYDLNSYKNWKFSL